MISVDLRSLVSKFNPTCRQALEQAVGFTLSRGQYNVEVEHLLLKLFEVQRSDVVALANLFEIDPGRVREDITKVVDRFKTGNTRTPGLSPNLITLGREAWLLGSLQFGARQVRSGHLLAALFADDALAPMAREMSRQFANVTADQIRAGLPRIADQTEEVEKAAAEPAAGGAVQGMPGAPQGGALDQFTTDLTAEARAGPHRPRGRARLGGAPDHRHPDPPAPEQPDPDRRGGCRQDGGGRGIRAARRGGRCALDARGCRDPGARSRPCCRRAPRPRASSRSG